ncbi:MAG: MFS transporter [Theionarchaea archaeon]|nr:MFS transporter [Theionarchaea archaeon]
MKHKSVLLFTALAHSLDHSYIVVFSIVMPLIMVEFNMSYSEIGLIGSLIAFLFGLNAIPAGFLSDRIGSRKIAALSILFCSIAAALVSIAWNRITLALFFIVMGIGAGLYHPSGISLVSKAFEKHRSKAMGIHGIGGNLGQAITPILTAFLASPEVVPLVFFSAAGLGLGWRTTYLLWAIPGILVFAGIIAFVRFTEEPVREIPIKTMLKDMARIPFDNRNIAILLILTSFQGLYFNGLMYFLPTIIRDVKFAPLIVVGLLTGLKEGMGALGQAFGGWSGDRYSKRSLLIAFNLVSTLTLAWFFFAENTVGIVLSVALMGVSVYAFQPIQNALIAENIPTDLRGRAYGLSFFTSYGIGGLAPLFSGAVAQIFSLSAVIPLMISFAVIATLVATQIKQSPPP